MSSPQEHGIHAKIVCGPDLRRVDMPANMTYGDFSSRLMAMFNLESGTFMVKYTDDERDKVTITDDAELSAAIASARQVGLSPLCPPGPLGPLAPR